MQDSSVTKHRGENRSPFPCRTLDAKWSELFDKCKRDESEIRKVGQLFLLIQGKLINKKNPKVSYDEAPVDKGKATSWVVVFVGKKNHQIYNSRLYSILA